MIGEKFWKFFKFSLKGIDKQESRICL